MFSSFFSTAKGYLYTAGAIVVAVFVAIFQYRGSKIDALKQDVETEKVNVKEVEAAIEKVEKVAELKEKYNEIDKTIIKSSDSDKLDRVSKFYRD